MKVNFELLNEKHKKEVLWIFNYYIQTSTCAYRDELVDDSFFNNFLDAVENYCGFAVVDKDSSNVIGFGLLEPYVALSTFSETAELMYFIHPDYTGKGIGSILLKKLEENAKKIGIKKLIADISTENIESIEFHKKNGFVEQGRLQNIAKKFGRYFGIVIMVKDISK